MKSMIGAMQFVGNRFHSNLIATSLFFLLPCFTRAQNVSDPIAQGEKVFNQTCATGYCHGVKGAAGGAPRLFSRGFDREFINTTVTHGISGTPMPAFETSLDRQALAAVVAYVASLNGIANPSTVDSPPPAVKFSPEESRGHDLFFDATRGFARCSTCHEVNRVGIPVATPIADVPRDAAALRNLATPSVHTATLNGESMPVLVVSEGKRRTIVYDLTVAPPVLRTVDPPAIRIATGSSWKHANLAGTYTDAELSAILTYLRAVIRP
jgi:cytochrome c553